MIGKPSLKEILAARASQMRANGFAPYALAALLRGALRRAKKKGK